MTTNDEWQARKQAAVARGQGNASPIYVERAENAELWDVEGKLPQRMTRGGLSPPSQKRAHHGNRPSPSVRVLQGRETDRQVREDQRWLV